MRAVVTRVKEASVEIGGKRVGEIRKGFLVLLGVHVSDTEETAIPLYELVISECRERGFRVETGEFGADMQVMSVNDGPVTIVLDSEKI